MANVYAVKTGNWTDNTVWSTSAQPASADDVYANGFTVTINTSPTVLSVRTTSATGISAGGGFTATANGTTITASIFGGTTSCLTISPIAGSSISVIGTINGGTSGSARGIIFNGLGSLNLTSDVYGGSATNAFGCDNQNNGTLNITGNPVGGSAAEGVRHNGIGTVNIIGNPTGGVSSSYFAVNNTSTGTIVITGSAIASANGPAVNNSAGGVMRVTTAIGNGFGVGSSGTSNVAAVTSSGSLTYVQKLQFGSLGNTPVSGPIILTDNTTNSVQFYKEGGGTKTLADPAATSGIVPAASDVRSGVVFSSGNRTGTLAVPAAGSVALGVAVDNTTGTAVLTQANVRTAVGMASANLDSQLAAIPTTAAPTATAIRTEMDSNSTKLANLDATVSSRSTYSGADTSGTTTLLSRLTSGRASGLDNLDATVSSRLAASSYTAPPSASSIATAVWANATRTLTAAVYTTSDIASAVWAAATRTVTGGTVDTASNVPSASAVAAAVWSAATRTLTTAIDNSATIAAAVWGYASGRTITGGTVDTLVNSPSVPSAAAIAGAVWAAADKTGYSLTNAERQAISVAVQAGILNESDGQQILNAIVGAIGNQNVDQVALVAAIRADLERTGGTLATRLAASAYTTPPTSAQNASAVRSELATELGRIDATVSSRLAPSGTLARVTLTDTTTTLSNAPTVPTPQEIATATREELTPELARVANAATTQEVGDIVQEAMHP